MKEVKHELTELQEDFLKPLAAEAMSLQAQIQRFVDYVAREAKLPQSTNGYKLKIDPDGQGFLVGIVDDKETSNAPRV